MQKLLKMNFSNIKRSILLMIIVLIILPKAILAQGTIIYDTVYSVSLEGNFLGDPPNQPVNIYLPHGYDENSDLSYPVIYLLHGFGHTQDTWMPGSLFNMNIKIILDDLIADEKIQPLIVVMPNAYNKYRGSWYTNSEVIGDWENYIVFDLVDYIDDHYRTLPHPESRGITGHSMGGTGAFTLAMKHPEIYSAVFSLSAGFISFEHSILAAQYKGYLIEAAKETDATNFASFHWRKQVMIASAAAFAPDITDLPFYGSFPVNIDGTLIDSIWVKWLEHDPYTIFGNYMSNLLLLDSIWIECGALDDLYTSNYNMYQALVNAGIETTWDSYYGYHLDKIPQRIEEKMLPFFSTTLSNATSIEYSDSYVPNHYILFQNYPNPFNPSTTIEFSLPVSEFVELKVYNILGKAVSTIVSKRLNPGNYTYTFEGENLASGIYYYQLVAGDYREVKKMILLK